ncbi:hypothetical protein AQJ30_15635 [Streptomyces longwoodensis]|uniref:Uncharacterized protein n=1 Tax=Streptomyces longwoodensis TaxID=68231 RepID=A0A101QX14_9ACTN|nr:hypothetical protein [Streptomyces longwoodensis]KUN37714.1 hypothetical protein AQJ30_15635 [Streptomyces longwoodensis]
MTATFDLADIFDGLADHRLRMDVAARARLAEALTDPTRAVDSSLVRDAMQKAANASPYLGVLEIAEKAGLVEALDDMRKRLTHRLLTRGMSSSTCQIHNENERFHLEAAQHFLTDTQGLVEAARAAAAQPAPAGEPEPEPDPAPAPARKVTPAQRRTLEAIRDNGVKLQELRVGQTRVSTERGEKPRKDMVEWAIDEGLAVRDNSRSLYEGQPVSLTPAGDAVLAA